MSNGWFATHNDFGATWGKKIGAAGIAIYQSLASRAWDGQCFPSYQTIAEDTGVSRPTAIKYIKKLQDAGLIEVQPRFNRRGDPTSNLYTLANLPQLKKKIETEVKPSFEEIDISGLSEDEIAELKRKSLFLPRTKKKSQKSPPATPATIPQAIPETPELPVSPALPVVQTVAVEAVVKSEPPTPPTPAVVPVIQGLQQEVYTPQILEIEEIIPGSDGDSAPKQRILLGEFGKISSQADIINAYHILKPVQNKQAIIDELNKAIRENRIQTTPIQYLYGLVRKEQRGEFIPSANKKTEEQLFLEQQERATEKENARKKAITECTRCNSVGHLVYSAIDEFNPKVKICTHDKRSDKFIAQKKAEEAEGKTICYFGKGTPLSEEEAKEALNAIRGTVTAMTGKTPTTIPLTPEPLVVESFQAQEPPPAAPVVAEPQPIVVVEPAKPVEVEPTPAPVQAQEDPAATTSPTQETQQTDPEKRYGGFKTMGELTTHLMKEIEQRRAQPKPEEEDDGLPKLSGPNYVVLLNQPTTPPELPDELPPIEEDKTPFTLLNISRTPSNEITNVPEHIIPQNTLPPELLEGFGQYTDKQKEKLLSFSEKLPSPTGKLLRKNGKPMSIMAEKILIAKQELEKLYRYDELIVQKEVRKYIQLQSTVRCARLRALVDKDTSHSEMLNGYALKFANAVQAAAPVMLTVTHARKNRLIIDSLIENYEAPADAPYADPPSDIMAQRYLDVLQELQIVRKYLAEVLDMKHRRAAEAKEPYDIDRLRKDTRGEKQHQLLNLIQDEIPEIKGDLVAANEYLPPEWKCSTYEFYWVKTHEFIQFETTRPVTPLPPLLP